MDNNKIGKFIASLRKEKKLTQQELADKLFLTDKAISKWERGLSLPDITLLNKLAKILDVDVKDILNGEKGTTQKIDIEKELESLKLELNQKNKKKILKITFCLVILLFIIIYLIFRNLSLGYNIEKINYQHSNRYINLGVPKTSFLSKNNDRSYSFKNLRNSNILENEIKKYLKTLNYSTCNNTIYYYNSKDNFSIINYSVKNHLLYSTISYEIVDKDYCLTEKKQEYSNKLNGLSRYHTLNDKISIPIDKTFIPRISIIFSDDYDSKTKEFTAEMKVNYLTPIPNDLKHIQVKELEKSKGTYEIKNDKLYYYRTEISLKANDIIIPEVSVFKIENGNLILLENYLSKYEENIVLK